MLILLDQKMPGPAKEKLAAYGELVEFATHGITYEAISGHPDIFFCPTPAGLIVAPNLPEKYLLLLEHNGIQFTIGDLPVGPEYPASARYNALFVGNKLIHNSIITDPTINRLNPDCEILHLKQGYTRCNLVALNNHLFITCDRGIEKALKRLELKALFVNPARVSLAGFENGFFGGACGIYNRNLFVCGSLNFMKEKTAIEAIAIEAGLTVVELYNGEPLDVGTILFLE